MADRYLGCTPSTPLTPRWSQQHSIHTLLVLPALYLYPHLAGPNSTLPTPRWSNSTRLLLTFVPPPPLPSRYIISYIQAMDEKNQKIFSFISNNKALNIMTCATLFFPPSSSCCTLGCFFLFVSSLCTPCCRLVGFSLACSITCHVCAHVCVCAHLCSGYVRSSCTPHAHRTSCTCCAAII